MFVNLTFHGVGEVPPSVGGEEHPYWLSRTAFEEVLDRFTGSTVLRVSFDDGNRSDLDRAVPALRERGLEATFFVVAGRLDQGRFLSRAAVRDLVSAGMKIGSHGMQHRPWCGLSERDLNSELRGSREILAAVIGQDVTEASCPMGRYDRRTLRALRRTGYRRVFTSDRGPARARAWLQPRTSLRQLEGLHPLDELITEPAIRHLLINEAKGLVRRWR